MVQSREIRAENVRTASLSSKDAERLLFMLYMARDMHTVKMTQRQRCVAIVQRYYLATMVGLRRFGAAPFVTVYTRYTYEIRRNTVQRHS